jgi:hypothetical protein
MPNSLAAALGVASSDKLGTIVIVRDAVWMRPQKGPPNVKHPSKRHVSTNRLGDHFASSGFDSGCASVRWVASSTA